MLWTVDLHGIVGAKCYEQFIYILFAATVLAAFLWPIDIFREFEVKITLDLIHFAAVDKKMSAIKDFNNKMMLCIK